MRIEHFLAMRSGSVGASGSETPTGLAMCNNGVLCPPGWDCDNKTTCARTNPDSPDIHNCSSDGECGANEICFEQTGYPSFCAPGVKKIGINPDDFKKDDGGGDSTSAEDAGPCSEWIISVQTQIGVNPDGTWGEKSQKALDATGKSFKDFAPGCTGGVPHWTAGTGTYIAPCKAEAAACGRTGDCCGSLVCEAGACAKPKPSSSTSALWILGGVVLAATVVGVAYGTGTIGGPRKNPFTDPHTRYRVLDLRDRHVAGITHDPAKASQIARRIRNSKNSHGAAVVRDVFWQGKWTQE